MEKSGWAFRWARYVVILFIAAGLAGVAHEFGHFLVARSLGYRPSMQFRDGGRVTIHDGNGQLVPSLPPRQALLFSAGGPALTLLLGAGFAALWLRRQESFPLFAFALMNSTARFNMVLDGFNSDEGNISEILINLIGRMGGLVVPLAVWTVCIGLSCLLMSRQSFWKQTYWLIPVFAVLNAVFFRLSFSLLSIVFD